MGPETIFAYIKAYLVLSYYIIEQVALDKSSLLLKISLQNAQTLQLFTNIFKPESIYMRY